jgi:hypothetical protein
MSTTESSEGIPTEAFPTQALDTEKLPTSEVQYLDIDTGHLQSESQNSGLLPEGLLRTLLEDEPHQ